MPTTHTETSREHGCRRSSARNQHVTCTPRRSSRSRPRGYLVLITALTEARVAPGLNSKWLGQLERDRVAPLRHCLGA